MRTYIFTVEIRGTGETEDEALTDAIEAVNDQGGIHPDSVIESRLEPTLAELIADDPYREV